MTSTKKAGKILETLKLSRIPDDCSNRDFTARLSYEYVILMAQILLLLYSEIPHAMKF